MEPSINSHTSIDIAEDILEMLNTKKQWSILVAAKNVYFLSLLLIIHQQILVV
jgi:hypothetical protein